MTNMFEEIKQQVVNFKKQKEDFFARMKNYKISYFTSRIIIYYILMCICSVVVFVIPLFIIETKQNFDDAIMITWIIFTCLMIIAEICCVVFIFKLNSLQFKLGKLSSGLKSFAMLVVPLYLILLLCYMLIPQGKEIILSLFAAVTTISTAILTIMGVHYTLVQQKNERIDKNNLVFNLNEDSGVKSKYEIKNALGDINLDLTIKNISNNFGYIIGIYKLCGCDVYRIGDEFPYLAIQPNNCLTISNLKINNGDDQLVFVYRDIGENYYYLLLAISGDQICNIEKSGKCDFEFLQNQIIATNETEKIVKSKKEREKNIKVELSQREKEESSFENEEMDISKRKEETKPNRTMNRDGFELIVSEDGDTTDFDLLTALRKERLRLAKEKKIKAYMIFNNQQLVALATYKPDNEKSFISIYGLGKKKYDLYGNTFIQIIKDYEQSKFVA